MRIRLPTPHGTVEFEAELSWEREEEGRIFTGWTFTRIRREARKAITDYIEAHPEEVLPDPADE